MTFARRACGLALTASAVLLSPAATALAAPDGRAYELVSPPDTNGTDVYNQPSRGFGQAGTVVASEDGERVAFSAYAAFAGAPSTGLAGLATYQADRHASGWETVSLQPPMVGAPAAANGAGRPIAMTPDLGTAFVISNQRYDASIPSNVFYQLYRRESDGSLTALGTPAGGGVQTFLGASEDGSHAAFTSGELVAGAGSNVYEWVDGSLRVVGVLPDGTVAPNSGAARNDSQLAVARRRQVSADGSHIYFRSSGSGKLELYVRIDGARTVAISASQRAVPDPAATAATARVFQGSSADGRVAWFTSKENLTDDANTGTADAGNDLYRYDLDSGRLTDVSVSANVARGANVLGTLGVSEDGSTAYFATENAIDGAGTDGGFNLFVSRDGETSFIGALAAADATNWRSGLGTHETARISPDGDQLVFVSVAPLTGYDNRDAVSGALRTQVFRYDATAAPADALLCVSCNPSGARPVGASTIQGATDQTTNNPTGSLPRNLSDDGSRVFFDSADRLLPAAVNGRSNVYLWQDGALQLISSGSGPDDAYFGDASASGDDVFFTTVEPLVPLVRDEKVALWDARVGGGFPLPQTQPLCIGDACQGTPAPRLPLSQPPSASFVGRGNVPTPVPSLTVSALGAAARRALARGGSATLVATVGTAGRLTATGTAKLPGAKTRTTVLSAAREATAAGTLRIPLRLSAPARRALKAGRTVSVRLVVRQYGVTEVRSQTLRLAGAKQQRSARTANHSSRNR